MTIKDAEELAKLAHECGFNPDNAYAAAAIALWKELRILRGQDDAAEGLGFTVDQRVLFRFYTEWIPATVVKINPKRVTIVDDRFKMTRSVHPKAIRPIDTVPPAVTPSSSFA